MRYLIILVLLTVKADAQSKKVAEGPKAPRLIIGRWLRGSPINELQRGKVYVIRVTSARRDNDRWRSTERFAELAFQYRDKATFADIYRTGDDDNEQDADTYVGKAKHPADYSAGTDDSSGSSHVWMTLAKNYSFPHVFIVNRQGLIVWEGPPGHLLFEDIIEQVIKQDKPLKEINESKIASMLGPLKKVQLAANYGEGDLREAIKLCDSLITAFPFYEDFYTEKLQVLHIFDRHQAVIFARQQNQLNSEKDVLSRTTKQDKLVYRSLISKAVNEKQFGMNRLEDYFKRLYVYRTNNFRMILFPLSRLYTMAYFRFIELKETDSLYSRFLADPVLEIANKSPFMYNYDTEESDKGLFNYDLTAPLELMSEGYVMREMQNALKSSFGYEATVETRVVPVWKLVAKPGAVEKLKTKGQEKYETPGSHAMGFKVVNQSPELLIAYLCFYLPQKFKTPLIDETGLSVNFDFSLQADMTNIEDIRNQLKLQGLDLVPGEKEMKVLVIRDAKTNLN